MTLHWCLHPLCNSLFIIKPFQGRSLLPHVSNCGITASPSRLSRPLSIHTEKSSWKHCIKQKSSVRGKRLKVRYFHIMTLKSWRWIYMSGRRKRLERPSRLSCMNSQKSNSHKTMLAITKMINLPTERSGPWTGAGQPCLVVFICRLAINDYTRETFFKLTHCTRAQFISSKHKGVGRGWNENQ